MVSDFHQDFQQSSYLTFYVIIDQNLTHCFVSGRCIYTIYLISDAYLGLDQQYNINLDVIAAENNQRNDEYEFNEKM